MRRRRNDDNYPVGDESATKSAYCRKLLQVCQVRSKFPNCQSNRLSHYLLAYIISHLFVKNNIFCKFIP